MDLAISQQRCPVRKIGRDGVALLPETLNAVRDLGSFLSFVRELCHRQGEWLQKSGDSQWSSIYGVKTDITNQTRRDVFRVLVVPAHASLALRALVDFLRRARRKRPRAPTAAI